MSNESYEAANRNAWSMVRGCTEAVIEQLRWWAKNKARVDASDTDADYWRDELTDDLSDRIHEVVDGAIIYTSDQWDCARCLPCDETPADLGMERGDIGELIQAQAYLAVFRCVRESSELEEAIQVIADELATRAANMTAESEG